MEQLSPEERRLRRRVDALGESIKAREAEFTDLKARFELEKSGRLSAQRGLIGYVRALAQLGEWFRDQPPTPELEAKLRQLGLWGIEVGYDPDANGN